MHKLFLLPMFLMLMSCQELGNNELSDYNSKVSEEYFSIASEAAEGLEGVEADIEMDDFQFQRTSVGQGNSNEQLAYADNSQQSGGQKENQPSPK